MGLIIASGMFLIIPAALAFNGASTNDASAVLIGMYGIFQALVTIVAAVEVRQIKRKLGLS